MSDHPPISNRFIVSHADVQPGQHLTVTLTADGPFDYSEMIPMVNGRHLAIIPADWLASNRPEVGRANATDPASLAAAHRAIDEAIDNVWTMSAEHILAVNPSRAEDRFVAVAHLLDHLADLLDGVMADDPTAIRAAAAWLAANRGEDGS